MWPIKLFLRFCIEIYLNILSASIKNACVKTVAINPFESISGENRELFNTKIPFLAKIKQIQNFLARNSVRCFYHLTKWSKSYLIN